MRSHDFWMGSGLAVIIVFFTTANAAVRHFSRVGLSERLAKRGKAALLNRLVENRGELLFISSFARLSAILALVLLIAHLFGVRASPGDGVVGHAAAQYGAIFLTAVVLIMLVGVAIPNAWARYGGDAFLAATLPVLFVLQKILFPLVACQRLVDWLARRLAGIPAENDQQTEAEEIEKEILDVVSEGELAGAVHEEDADMIESVMEFRDTDVGEIMTPRTEIVALPATATLIEAKELIARAGHSRIPVYDENIDDLEGVLYAKDLLNVKETDHFDPIDMMRKVPYVPESKRIPDLLGELREQKVHLAIVLDEYGGTAGLVTIEDILEEIVGEIADEYEAPEPDPIRRIDASTIEVDARVHIDELNDELGIKLPEDEDYDTVGGFVFSVLGKIPATGEELRYDNVKFQVIDAEERKINRLRVEVVADQAQV